MPVFPGPVCRHFHFPKLNNICHFSDHLTNLSVSSCTFCLSPISIVFLNSLVSSANFNMLPVTPSSKSFMYTKNKIGPSTDPCGTPLKTDFQLETSPSTYCTYVAAICVSFNFFRSIDGTKRFIICIKMCKMTSHSCLYPNWLQRYGINYMSWTSRWPSLIWSL